MATDTRAQASRLSAVLREGERVMPLELFFDLVFVLALTQCTSLMSHDPTWSGLVQGVLVLGVLWWSWTGYAWLTSIVDPEEGAVRAAHIALFVLASREDPALRSSVTGLGISTAIGVGLLAGASALDGLAQGALWGAALLLDMGGPFFFGAEGWKLVPGHFAERHALIVIIALGESIVAIGAGAAAQLSVGIVAAAVLGIALAAALWWIYFDVVALVSRG